MNFGFSPLGTIGHGIETDLEVIGTQQTAADELHLSGGNGMRR